LLIRSNRHPNLLRADDTQLVVVDMQEAFLRVIWERERVVKNVVTLMEAARVLRMPIVPTLQYAERLGDPIPEVKKRLPPQCVPFDKMCFSCMGEEAFASEVLRSGRKQVLLCGVETHICISQTAHDLLAQGYQVHVAADAVSSRTQSNWEIGLSRMERAGILLSSTEMAIYELMYEAGTPEFKEILEFVK
jgi:nicotinamidase-related amidase